MSKSQPSVEAYKLLAECNHDMVVAMRAALIEWRHGRGAEAALDWIVNSQP